MCSLPLRPGEEAAELSESSAAARTLVGSPGSVNPPVRVKEKNRQAQLTGVPDRRPRPGANHLRPLRRRDQIIRTVHNVMIANQVRLRVAHLVNTTRDEEMTERTVPIHIRRVNTNTNPQRSAEQVHLRVRADAIPMPSPPGAQLNQQPQQIHPLERRQPVTRPGEPRDPSQIHSLPSTPGTAPGSPPNKNRSGTP
jgi:hypothetical protein